jgi:radical SAM protein (TIGR01212 family)
MAVSLNEHYRKRFGCKVYKLSLDGGFTCPNRDGTLDTRGCIFCSAYGGGEFAQGQCESVASQLEKAKSRVAAKNKGGKYIAYFQSFTGTYAPVERLRQLYLEATAPEDIVGLAIGTRPDCLSDQVIDLLAQINRAKPVSVELGLQTIHEETARYSRRGYETRVYFDAVKRLKAAGLEVVTHIIIGLPGETPQMAVETTRAAVEAGTDGVKFHLLHVLRGTDLEEEYLRGNFRCLELEEYARILDACLAQLPPRTVLHRITGDGAKRDLVAPLWSADKKRVLNYLNRNLTHK